MTPPHRGKSWKNCSIVSSTPWWISGVRGSVSRELGENLPKLLFYHVFYQRGCVRSVMRRRRTTTHEKGLYSQWEDPPKERFWLSSELE